MQIIDQLEEETVSAMDNIKPILDKLFTNKTDVEKLDIYDMLADFIWIDYDIKTPDGYGKKPNDTI